MDQLVLQWLSNKETNRHNIVVAAETKRHNLATENEAKRHNFQQESIARQQIYSNERIQAANRSAQVQMNTYTANKHLESTKYSADSSREAQRYSASQSAWASQYRTMVEATTQRQANTIQDRYNQGRLAIATSEMEETKRANRAREEENRASRLQTAELRMKELDLGRDRLTYEQSRDIADRAQRQLQHEQKMRAEYTKQAIDLLEVGSKWYTATKGVKRINVQENKQNQSLFQKALEELTKQGR